MPHCRLRSWWFHIMGRVKQRRTDAARIAVRAEQLEAAHAAEGAEAHALEESGGVVVRLLWWRVRIRGAAGGAAAEVQCHLQWAIRVALHLRSVVRLVELTERAGEGSRSNAAASLSAVSAVSFFLSDVS